jgi:hypothetical protein
MNSRFITIDMKRNKKINPTDSVKMMTGIQRELMLEQGFFDGRFRSKSIASKKIYKRKVKHKNTK